MAIWSLSLTNKLTSSQVTAYEKRQFHMQTSFSLKYFVTDCSLVLPLLSCESWMFMKENPDRKKIYTIIHWEIIHKIEYDKTKKITVVSENVCDKKNIHLGGRKFIFLNRFSGGVPFSSLVSFAFLILVFFLLYLFDDFWNEKCIFWNTFHYAGGWMINNFSLGRFLLDIYIFYSQICQIRIESS